MGKQIAIIGNAVVDLIRSVPSLPPLDERTDNTRVIVQQTAEVVGGNAINTALVLAKISDCSIATFTSLSDDYFGELIRRSCRNGTAEAEENLLEGEIELFNANADNRNPTGTAVVLHAQSANRTMFLYHPACNARLDVAFLRRHLDTLGGASLLHICGFGGLRGIDRGENLSDFIGLLKSVRQRNPSIEILLDVMFLDDQAMRESDLRDQITTLLKEIDFFLPNELEARQYSSQSAADIAQLAQLYNRDVRSATIIKRGPRGVMIFPRAGDPIDIAPKMVLDASKIVDTVGAGDAWCAGFLDVLARSDRADVQRLRNACARGNEIAAISLRGRGGNAAFFDADSKSSE